MSKHVPFSTRKMRRMDENCIFSEGRTYVYLYKIKPLTKAKHFELQHVSFENNYVCHHCAF